MPQKSTLNSNIWVVYLHLNPPTNFHEEFLHSKNNHPNHICIYTDGSKNGNKVSCAAIQHNTKITKQLPNSTSIYSAETKAIDLALNIITNKIHQIHHFF